MGWQARQRRNALITQMMATVFRDAEVAASSPDICRVCSKPVRVMVYRGTRFCSQLCEQVGR